MDKRTTQFNAMTIDELKELLKKFDSSITYSADLKKKNWFNIGGKAKCSVQHSGLFFISGKLELYRI